MKHYGDITKINGALAEPVNVIIGGSPCQDLSVSGKRAGLAGERSGLFMEQLRIIKEMRYADEFIRGRKGVDIRPRFMVWENVPGAFSSNKGEDFGAVLQETLCVVCQETPTIPMPKNGWPLAGCLIGMGGQSSVAWRVFDAQFWGVPQRRRRIALIADFGGTTAGEILFERESVSGDFTQSGTAWKETPAYVENSPLRNDCVLLEARGEIAGFNGYKSHYADIQYAEDKAPTIEATMPPDVVCMATQQGARAQGIAYEVEKAPTLFAMTHDASVVMAIENHPKDSRVKLSENGIVQTLSAAMGTGGGNTPMVLECYSQDAYDRYTPNEVAATIKNTGGVYGGGIGGIDS